VAGFGEGEPLMSDKAKPLTTTPVRARRNLRLIMSGVLAICLGGLGAAMLYANLANAQSVIAVTRTVYRDQLITTEDLAVISLATAPGLETVSASRISDVVGRTALTDLTAGSALSPRSFGEPPVEVGVSRLGVKLAPGRMPGTPLPPGTQVLLVAVARDGGDPPAGASVMGRVASTASDLPDGSAVLDITVPQAEAERIARLAAGDQLVVVRQPGAPR
jgi:hypothetical protein